MFEELINYIGVDNFSINSFKWIYPFKFEGTLFIKDNIQDLLSFSISKNFINYKVINTFEDINFEGYEVKSNLVSINNKFDLFFEYGSSDQVSKMCIFNDTIYKSFLISLDYYENNSLDINILITHLFCKKLSNNNIFYCVNLIVGINPR